MTNASGRDVALHAVRAALTGKAFAGQVLRAERDELHLAGREAGFATQVALGAVRHLLTIEHVLSAVARFDRRRVPRTLRAILYCAAYQVLWMDRVPVFAAVDEAVAQAHRHVGGRSPGMVNAVLRQLVRAIGERRVAWQRLDPHQVRVSWDQACAFSRDVLPPADAADGFMTHLAAATGERLERYHTLVARFGAERAEQIVWASQAVPVTVLQRQTLRIGPDEFRTGVISVSAATGIESTADAAFLPASLHLSDIPLFVEGKAFVQDPTARAAAVLVAAQPGERVLDLCAAPGGKSMALALQMQDRGEIVACDVSPQRLERVQENTRRLGLSCIRTHVLPAAIPRERPALGTFDAALVDVPCTNTGVIARRPEARLSFSAHKLRALLAPQRDLLRLAATHVRPGGRLVYSTCSLEPEENERQVEQFLAEHPDWSLDHQETTLPRWGPRLADWHDGGFAARLVHLAD